MPAYAQADDVERILEGRWNVPKKANGQGFGTQQRGRQKLKNEANQAHQAPETVDSETKTAD